MDVKELSSFPAFKVANVLGIFFSYHVQFGGGGGSESTRYFDLHKGQKIPSASTLAAGHFQQAVKEGPCFSLGRNHAGQRSVAVRRQVILGQTHTSSNLVVQL